MEEMRNLLGENGSSPEVQVERLRMLVGNDDIHYAGGLMSGCRMLEKCVDAATILCIRRDNGDGSMCANIKADVFASGACDDTIEIVVKSVKDGKRSRVYAFEMYKLIEFDLATYWYKVLDEPLLMVKGEVTLVVKKER